ncbi:MAG: cyclic nucleotide-binding domain-containing protein [Pirellulaceae bacterium]|nr:cyclic nucleotide-binding domain-containing protein [Pirellulaceae bacterium]
MLNADPKLATVDITTEPRIEDEGLFARDVDGRLIRLERAQAQDFDKTIKLKIDGVDVEIKKAVETRDSEGDIIRDSEGRPIPRFSTIYDAASQAFVSGTTDVHPIPTLCHREHLPPLGACRVCLVEAAEMTRRGLKRQFVPACVQRVSDGMEVHTLNSTADSDAATRVRDAVRVITELMLADHAPTATPTETLIASNELLQVKQRLGIDTPRFSPKPRSGKLDLSSYMINVNRDECIMCGRCQRGCNWVKENKIIGRSGKGYEAKVIFGLDAAMSDSGCVSCGECAISCPTGAMTFKESFVSEHLGRVRAELQQPGTELTIDELVKIDWFRGIPYKFLLLNAASITRRHLQPGEELCREGDYGSTAFLIEGGSFEIKIKSQTDLRLQTKQASGLLGWLGRLTTGTTPSTDKRGPRLLDAGGQTVTSNQPIIRTVDDRILGEMSCLNRSRRSASIIAREVSSVLEIRRNVLDMLLRNRASREILDKVYFARIKTQLSSLPMFQDVDEQTKEQAVTWLKQHAELVRVDPGQPIFKQGDQADNFYIVSLGFVKVSQKLGESERVIRYIGPGNSFGEIALLSKLDEIRELNPGVLNGKRTATCSALDHVELFKISGSDFQTLVANFPSLKGSFIAEAKRILARDQEQQKRIQYDWDRDFVEQGLYGAQNLLAIDLERCTRCDECTKACADTHQGVTRLIRDGMRYDRFLIAASCRSCMDPYCMVGCPVDAIHRNGESLQIEIEDYCIGCGLCAENCPYGNINMHGFPKRDKETGQKVIQQRATTCDMCMDVGGGPSCVRACPHDAAYRVDGKGLHQLTALNKTSW